jgi:hypothetical protein
MARSSATVGRVSEASTSAMNAASFDVALAVCTAAG